MFACTSPKGPLESYRGRGIQGLIQGTARSHSGEHRDCHGVQVTQWGTWGLSWSAGHTVGNVGTVMECRSHSGERGDCHGVQVTQWGTWGLSWSAGQTVGNMGTISYIVATM